MYFLYSLLAAAAFALLSPYFLVKGLREGKYLHSLRQRFGFLPPELRRAAVNPHGAIWLHAVSVGELLAALPLARQLKQGFPQHRLVISTTTRTGQELARQRCAFADGIFYFPLDWGWIVRRVLRAVRPAVVVVLETEIWPNFLRQARRAGVPVVFVNGRISEKSFRRSVRLLSVSGALEAFYAQVLDDGALYLMQSEADAQRLRQLGAPPERVEVTGNLKFDFAPPEDSPFVAWLEKQVVQQERRPLLVAGSVVAGEEAAVLAGYDLVSRRWRRALLVLAPRKPERFAAAAELIAQEGWTVIRRSRLDLTTPLDEYADVLLLDSVGELAGVYRLADAVFVGGSLVPSGGHNILEPAWFAHPPVFGPHMENFRAVADAFLQAGAGLCVASGQELGTAWSKLIEDVQLRERMGQAARNLVERSRGATARSLERIRALLERREVRA
jgi:3-deoxy-D-manno-octulosonic-acid transferase